MRRAFSLLALLLMMSLFSVQPSRAQLTECRDEYVRLFDVPPSPGQPAWSAGDIDCRVHFEVLVDAPTGDAIVSVIGDVNIASHLPPGGLEAIRNGIEASGAALRDVGRFNLWDTTILIAPARASSSEPQPRFGYSDAWTLPGAGEDGRYAECHVTLFPGTDYSADELRYIVAHELFHCVQEATLTEAQNATQTGRGLWWIEGSAEWFAAYAIGPQERWARAPGFDEQVAAGEALHGMTYHTAIFFYWYHHAHGGASRIIPFLHRMSEGADASSQEVAMQNVLTDPEWLRFAQAYDDREIDFPRGGRVPFGQQLQGEVWNVSGDLSIHTRTLKPFVIAPGWVNYSCGRWDNNVTSANLEVRHDSERNWSAWPSEINTRSLRGAIGRYRMIALTTRGGEIEYRLEAERREACQDCMVTNVIDRCMVGTWEQVSGGPMDFLRNMPNMPEITRDLVGKLVIVVNADGTMATRSVSIDYQLVIPSRDGDRINDTFGEITASAGRWSAEDGRLQACFDSGGEASGVTTTTYPDRSHTRFFESPSTAGINGSSEYTCNETTLVTTPRSESGTSMPFTFRRVTPPPRR